MSYVFKRSFFSRLIFFVVAVSFFAIAHAVTEVPKQEVYLSEEPLLKIADRLKDQGMSQKQIVEYLKSTLPKISPELAQEKFGIRWIDNQLQDEYIQQLQQKPQELDNKASRRRRATAKSPFKYPAVAICYIGPEVGYGLFALERIKANSAIVEYTGKHVKDEKSFKNNSYVANLDGGGLSFEKIDAEYCGNAARFANHLLTEDDLVFYQYDFSDSHVLKEDLAVANSGLLLLGALQDRHLALVATKDIKLFEQIGFSYDNSYGYEHSQWPQEPYLFDKNGNVIPNHQYRVLNKGLRFADELNNKTMLFILTPEQLESWKKNVYTRGNYIISRTGNDELQYVIVNLEAWKAQMAKPVNRLSVPAYLVGSEKELAGVLGLLELMDKYAVGVEKRNEYLRVARDSGYTQEKLSELMSYIVKNSPLNVKDDL